MDDSFHQALKAGRAAQQAHGAGNPLELAHARHREGCVRASPGVQNHLPKPSSEVDCTEDSTPRSTNFTNALTKYANDSVDAFANFLFTQMFKAAAPENVCAAICILCNLHIVQCAYVAVISNICLSPKSPVESRFHGV